MVLAPVAAGAEVEVWDVRAVSVVGDELPPLDHPVVALDVTNDGRGTWLAAADGGVFTLGGAPFHGSAGGMGLGSPIVSIDHRPRRPENHCPSRTAAIPIRRSLPSRRSLRHAFL